MFKSRRKKEGTHAARTNIVILYEHHYYCYYYESEENEGNSSLPQLKVLPVFLLSQVSELDDDNCVLTTE
jgi:hypothetical protein